MKAYLASKVEKLGFSALCTGFVKLDLANFLSFLLLLLITLLLSTPVTGRAPADWKLIFNMEVSGAAILMKPWMKRR